MIDKNKIKSAAQGYCDATYGTLNTNPFIAEAFRKGANWAINEFLKDLWHPFNEVPTRKSSNILLFFESYSTGTEDDYNEYFDLAYTREGFTQKTWKEFVNEGGIPSKWLYLDDLFPKEEGEQ